MFAPPVRAGPLRQVPHNRDAPTTLKIYADRHKNPLRQVRMRAEIRRPPCQAPSNKPPERQLEVAGVSWCRSASKATMMVH